MSKTNIIDELLATLPEKPVPVRSIVVGAHWTAVCSDHCGLLGGNAKSVLDTAGIAQYVYHGGGTVRAALDAFRNNALDQVS